MEKYGYEGSRRQALDTEKRKGLKRMQEISFAAKYHDRSLTEAEKAELEDLYRRDDKINEEIEMIEHYANRRITSPNPLDDNDLPRRGRRTSSGNGDPNRGFGSPREFLRCVMAAGMGNTPDARLTQLAVGSDEARGNSDPAGGYLVPEGFHPEVLRVPAEIDPLAARVRQVPMEFPTTKIPARVDKNHSTSVSGGVTFTRRPETVSATSSQVTYEIVTLNATSLMGLSYATEEIMMDSASAFMELLMTSYQDELGGHLMNERINGTGVGEFEGILNTPCLISVAKESGQAAATLVYENIIKMRARCWGYNRAVWLANHNTLPQLMLLTQSVGTGGQPVWQPSAREDRPDTLLGRPLLFTEYAQTLGTKGDIICGAWGEYLEGTYQPLQSAESIHVRFINHERTFKFWMRNAGRPWWRSALTPRQGDTLSPFVVLDTRS